MNILESFDYQLELLSKLKASSVSYEALEETLRHNQASLQALEEAVKDAQVESNPDPVEDVKVILDGCSPLEVEKVLVYIRDVLGVEVAWKL